MTEEEFQRHAAEAKRLIEKPEPPAELSEEPEFEEVAFVDNGETITVRRANPRYKKSCAGSE